MAARQVGAAPVVLVVDDEPAVLRLMERALASANYQVHAVPDGLRAIEAFGRLPVPPAVMVTDLRMEPIDGADLGRLVASQWPSTRILFVTGFLEDSDSRRLAGPLLHKPFSPEQLVEAVKRLLQPAAVV